ncbi:glycosyl hydrolase [Violaceomyces palustris]|uniref:Glycosyl hydrolase n=1 Tax=Violaceomyces palustris TaxID=1673888 RepID=A0ACD0NTZ8_9BASI|nr:glycosyl hydrolase [Violaceomyces palustris]
MPQQESSEELVAKLIYKLLNNDQGADQFLLTLSDGRVIDTKGWNGWEWTHGVALFGLWEHHSLSLDPSSLEIITDWFEDRMAQGGTTKNINTMAPFLALACVVEKYPDHPNRVKYVGWLDEWAEWAMNGLARTEEGGFQHVTYVSDHDQQLWDDTLVMTVLPLAKIGIVLNRPHYLEEARYQFLLHVRYLSDTRTGLWFHGWNFNGRHNFAKALWARGNCWITLAIPMFLGMMMAARGETRWSAKWEEEDGLSRTLVSTLLCQLDKLCEVQDASTGLFHTLLDDPGSYLESSATAGFAAGALLALRLDMVPASDPRRGKYENMARKALSGVVSMIAEDGELRQTSFGTAMGHDLDFYRKIPITPMPYGQALALFAIVQGMASERSSSSSSSL